MVNSIRITFDEAIQDLMDREELIKLAESIHTFIEMGAIDCEDGDELFVDQDYIIELVAGIEAVRKATKKYGRDTDGFVKYQFKV